MVMAEKSELASHKELKTRFVVKPFAIETSDVLGAPTDSFVRDLGKRIGLASEDRRATEFLHQRVSFEVQRGNAAAVHGSHPMNSLRIVVATLYGHRHP